MSNSKPLQKTNVFLGIILFMLSAVIYLNFPSTVSSQKVEDGTFVKKNELASVSDNDTSSQPEVYIKDLILDDYFFRAGDLVKGSFILMNGKNVSVSNLSYRVFLVGDLMENTLYRYEFDSHISDTIFLDRGEEKTIYFEYVLPLSSSAYTLDKQLGIKIKAFSGSGFPLGWSDTQVSVSDLGLTPVVIANASVVVEEKIYDLNEGPMVHDNQTVSLKMSIINNDDSKIDELVPRFSIYEMDYAKTPLSSYSGEEFSLEAKSKGGFTFSLPVFNYTPKVYAGEMTIEDKNGVNRTNPIKFRYIVYGEVVNIQNVFVESSVLKKNKKFDINIHYTGSPYDIDRGDAAEPTPSKLSLKLFNEKKELVAEHDEMMVFDAVAVKELSLIAGNHANILNVEITVSKNGEILTEYMTSLSSVQKETKSSQWPYAVIVSIISFVGVFFLIKKKKRVVVFAVCLIVGMNTPFATVEAQVKTVTRYRAWSHIAYPSLVVSSPVPNQQFAPGEKYWVKGSATMVGCNNSNNYLRVQVRKPTARVSLYEDNVPPYTGISWNPGYPNINNQNIFVNESKEKASGTWQSNDCNTSAHAWCNSTIEYSLGQFTAPTTPGTYRIYIYNKDYMAKPGDYDRVGHIFGYQDIVVTPKTAGICAATHNNCVKGNLGGTASYPDASHPDLYRYDWWCNGVGGGENVLCKEEKIHGLCGEDQWFTCAKGNLGSTASYPDDSHPDLYRFDWWCKSPNGGIDALCHQDKIHGECSSTRYKCEAGNLGRVFEYPDSDYPNKYSYNWWCDSVNQGRGELCTEEKLPRDGVCGETHYNCITGDLGQTFDYPNADYPDKYKYEWRCKGINGGQNSQLCIENKASNELAITFKISPAIADENNKCLARWTVSGGATSTCKIITEFNETEVPLEIINSSSSTTTRTSHVSAGNKYRLQCTTQTGTNTVVTSPEAICIDPDFMQI